MQRQADAYSPEELGEVLDKYDAKSPMKNPLTKPFPFNLMFKVQEPVVVGDAVAVVSCVCLYGATVMIPPACVHYCLFCFVFVVLWARSTLLY